MAAGQSETLKQFQELAEEVLGVTGRLEHAGKQVDAGAAAVARCVEQVQAAGDRTRVREEELAHGYVRVSQQMARLEAGLAEQVEAHKAAVEMMEQYLKLLNVLPWPTRLSLALGALVAGVAGGMVGTMVLSALALWWSQ